MVVTVLPATLEMGRMHERTAAPLRCTVQAPHCAMPQPNFVPLRSSTSRSTHSSGMSAGTSTVAGFPLTVSVGGGVGGFWGKDTFEATEEIKKGERGGGRSRP